MDTQLDLSDLFTAFITAYATLLATLYQVRPRVFIRRYVGPFYYDSEDESNEERGKEWRGPDRAHVVVTVYNSGAPLLINRAELAFGTTPLDVITGVPEVNQQECKWPVYLDNRTRLRIVFDVELREYELRVSDLCFLPCWLVAENGTVYKVPRAPAFFTEEARGLVRRTFKLRRLYRWWYRHVDRHWHYQ